MRESQLQRDKRPRLNPGGDDINLPNRTDDFFADTVNLQRQFSAVDVAQTGQQSQHSFRRWISGQVTSDEADLPRKSPSQS